MILPSARTARNQALPLLSLLPSPSISAAVAACERTESLSRTLARLQACVPPPAEILIHVDGDHPAVREVVAKSCPSARVLTSREPMGPGGARNRLTQAARFPWVAHFDDDSYPAHHSFFADAQSWISRLPASVAVLSAVIAPHEPPLEAGTLRGQAVYPGCGHLMNRAWFLRTQGYQPRPVAYNLEEVDVSLQLHALRASVVQVADLTVVHDHPIPPLESSIVEAATLVNTCLFPVLRYPLSLLPQAALSVARRVVTRILRHPNRWTILQLALRDLSASWPAILARRQPVPSSVAWRWLVLRRQPVLLTLSDDAIAPLAVGPSLQWH